MAVTVAVTIARTLARPYPIARIIEGAMIGWDADIYSVKYAGDDTARDLRYDLIDRAQRLTHKYQCTLNCDACGGTVRMHERNCPTLHVECCKCCPHKHA